jgi:hypothetical protein
MRNAGCAGFTHSDFFARIRDYRDLSTDEQFRVLVMLAKRPEVSSMIGRRRAWYFWPRSIAPREAFNINDAKRDAGKVIADAVDKS